MSVKLHLVLAAGGSSCRFGGKDKLLADLNGAPVFVHALRRLTPVVTGKCVIVVPQGRRLEFQEIALPFTRDLDLIWCEGGDSRSGSVRNGIKALGKAEFNAKVADQTLEKIFARVSALPPSQPNNRLLTELLPYYQQIIRSGKLPEEKIYSACRIIAQSAIRCGDYRSPKMLCVSS